MNEKIVIISDLHISCGPLDDFDDPIENEFCKFLDNLMNDGDSVELVINGDFLDFVQAPPSMGKHLEGKSLEGLDLCFTQSQSLSKFNSIAERHAEVFSSLSRFLCASNTNSITILPGNHDPDFFWPLVREAFTNLIASDSSVHRINFCLERGYTPPKCPWLWIEHGHQFDPINSFFVTGEERWSNSRPPIFISKNGEERLL